ncbi:MAG: ABC transporter substrate-binding protein [Anaerolineae bacterium]
MKLRTVALIGTLALGLPAAPVPAEAEQAGKVYRIGFLESPFPPIPLLTQNMGLQSLGYTEGRNAAFERVTARTDEELIAVAAELVRRKVDLIVASGLQAIRAAKNATKTTPVVMVAEGDPVGTGLVSSLARPGGNVTGLTLRNPQLAGKRLELLKEAVPSLVRVGVLWSPGSPESVEHWKEAQRAARLIGLELRSLEVRTETEIESLFEVAARERCGALLVSDDYLTRIRGRRIVALAEANRIPVVYTQGALWVNTFGGLMSYGANAFDLLRRAAVYVDKILKGAKPADLPVEQPTKFEFFVNMRAAKAIGLTIPPFLLFQADRVIR